MSPWCYVAQIWLGWSHNTVSKVTIRGKNSTKIYERLTKVTKINQKEVALKSQRALFDDTISSMIIVGG
jgi:hypothetical protein